MLKLFTKVTFFSVPLISVLKSVFIFKTAYTPNRIWNYLLILISMYVSKILKRPIVWGVAPIVMIEPTNICNLKCPMCPSGNNEMKRAKGMLAFKDFKKLVDDVGRKIYQLQFWNQGEPFLNKDLLQCIHYSKQNGIITQTSTNGHFIPDNETAEAIVASGLDQVIFSMDGTNQETYEKYRVGGNFNQVLAGLERLAEVKKKLKSVTPLIQLQFLVFKHNQNEIDNLIKLAQNNNINRISFKSAQIYSSEQGEEFLPDDESLNRYKQDSNEFVLKGDIKNWCKRLWLNTTINWDGSVTPCCFDKDAEHSFANYFNSNMPFKSIWKSTAYQDFCKQVLMNRKSIEMCCNCNEGLPEPYAKIVEVGR